MTSGTVKCEDASGKRPIRLRFSLKWLLFLIGIICVTLGFHAMLERQSREMLNLQQAIMDTLNDNFVTEPPSATFVNPAAVKRSAAKLKSQRASRQSRGPSVARSIGRRTLFVTNETNVFLDATQVLSSPNGKDFINDLPSHYAKGLEAIGLTRNSTSFSPGFSSETWQLPEHGVSVVIDAVLDEAAKRVTVRAIFIQNDRASVW